MLIDEFRTRPGVELEKIDDRERFFDLHKNDFGFDMVIERCINHSRAVHALKIFGDFGIPTVNTFEVAEVCGSKFLTTQALIKTGVPTPKCYMAFTPESALAAMDELGFPCVITIHVACWGEEAGHPYRTLLHEGTHQFIHLGAGYREPGRPAATPPRLALPLWLNEGLASYFEAAFLTPDLLQPGRPQPARLAELQNALRRDKAPPLGKIFARRYGEPFTTLDYAVAWGVVYALMQEAPPPWAAGGRAWLQALVDEARRGWPGAALAPSATVAGDQQWWATVTEQTRMAFATYTAERGLTVAAWEEQWRDWIVAHP